jgi:hypothetical protein
MSEPICFVLRLTGAYRSSTLGRNASSTSYPLVSYECRSGLYTTMPWPLVHHWLNRHLWLVIAEADSL